jgi:hypothetical protein
MGGVMAEEKYRSVVVKYEVGAYLRVSLVVIWVVAGE